MNKETLLKLVELQKEVKKMQDQKIIMHMNIGDSTEGVFLFAKHFIDIVKQLDLEFKYVAMNGGFKVYEFIYDGSRFYALCTQCEADNLEAKPIRRNANTIHTN